MAYGLLYDYLMGQCINGFKYFGAHFVTEKRKKGVVFRLYAPGASDVSVIGEWNSWDPGKDKLKKIDESGIWELFARIYERTILAVVATKRDDYGLQVHEDVFAHVFSESDMGISGVR